MNKFEVVSGEIVVSDPCYDADEWMNMTIPAKNGTWIAYVDETKFGSWGDRISILTAEFTGKTNKIRVKHGSIGVDSGQAGIFDINSYKNDKIVKNVKRVHNKPICEDEPWYSICCDRTLSKNQWGIVPNGVVSTSGLGDGYYDVEYFVDSKGQAVRVQIVFINDENSEKN